MSKPELQPALVVALRMTAACMRGCAHVVENSGHVADNCKKVGGRGFWVAAGCRMLGAGGEEDDFAAVAGKRGGVGGGQNGKTVV